MCVFILHHCLVFDFFYGINFYFYFFSHSDSMKVAVSILFYPLHSSYIKFSVCYYCRNAHTIDIFIEFRIDRIMKFIFWRIKLKILLNQRKNLHKKWLFSTFKIYVEKLLDYMFQCFSRLDAQLNFNVWYSSLITM